MKFYELFIASRYIKANIKQSIIITTAISIGVSLIVWIPSINLSFFDDLIDKAVASAPHITIKKEVDTFEVNKPILDLIFLDKKILLEDQIIPRKRNITSYKKVLDQIKDVEGIIATAPFAEGQAFIIRGGDERGTSIKGIVSEKETQVTDIADDIKEGRIKNLSINDIVIGNIRAEKLNLGIGDRVTVLGPRGTSKSLKVVGIFSTGLRANDEWQAYVNLKSGQQILDLGNDISGIGIKIKDIYEAENTAEEIRKLTGLEVRSWMQDNSQVLDQINRFKLIILFINFLIIFSAASSITSVFIMLIASKSKEIGILKSMGAKSYSVMTVFLTQAMFLCILGYIFGLIGAKLLIMWYANILSTGTGTIFSSEIPEFKISIHYAIIAFFYSILTSILASIIPSYQAAKLNPVEAING